MATDLPDGGTPPRHRGLFESARALTARRELESAVTEPNFRPLQPGDVEAVLDVFLAAFERGWPNIPISVSPLEHLQWKIDCPQPVPDGASVAEIDGRIIGYVGTVGRDAWVRGRRLYGRSGVDTAIHPDFQGRGINALWREWERDRRDPNLEEAGLGEGSTHPRLLRSQRRRNDRGFVAHKADVLVLPLDFAAVVSGGGPRWSPRALARAARLLGRQLLSRLRFRPFGEPPRALEVQAINSFDERADRLWERTRDSFEFAVVRDRTYLNWRYCDPRAGIYEVRAAVRPDGELAGYVVYGAIGRDAQIVDLFVEPGNVEAQRVLIEEVIGIARGKRAASLAIPMPRLHPYRDTLRRYGFIVSRPIPNLGYGHDRPRPNDFLLTESRAQYHYAFGDSDHI